LTLLSSVTNNNSHTQKVEQSSCRLTQTNCRTCRKGYFRLDETYMHLQLLFEDRNYKGLLNQLKKEPKG